MLSILIPVYNYDIRNLVYELHKQATKLDINFEILCLDDASNIKYSKLNFEVDVLPFTKYIQSEFNHGIAVSKQTLSQKAKYKWVLFIDADTFPKNAFFLKNYITYLKDNNSIIFGGFAYKNTRPDNTKLLRWLYGKHYEQVCAKKRNKNPYKITIAANLLIKKTTYLKFKINEVGKNYGMDLQLGAKLKQTQTQILHIDNEVYHLGLETSLNYLEKSKKAIKTLLFLSKKNTILQHSNSILTVFKNIKILKLHYPLRYVYITFKPEMETNLLGKTPNIKLLQFYKLTYMCYLYLKN